MKKQEVLQRAEQFNNQEPDNRVLFEEYQRPVLKVIGKLQQLIRGEVSGAATDRAGWRDHID